MELVASAATAAIATSATTASVSAPTTASATTKAAASATEVAASATTATARTLFALLRLVHFQLPSTKLKAVELLDSRLGGFGRLVLDKRKSARSLRRTVERQENVLDGTGLRKEISQFCSRCFEIEVTYEQFRAHSVFLVSNFQGLGIRYANPNKFQ